MIGIRPLSRVYQSYQELFLALVSSEETVIMIAAKAILQGGSPLGTFAASAESSVVGVIVPCSSLEDRKSSLRDLHLGIISVFCPSNCISC